MASSHYTGARETAHDYDLAISIVYAEDHLIAASLERAATKPASMPAEAWKRYKENTGAIQELAKSVHELAEALHKEA